MIVSEFVPSVFLSATGKQATFTTGSSKWLKIIALANIEIDNWADEPSVDWNSLYAPDTVIGTVSATKTYSYASTIRKISNQEGDVIRIIHPDGVAFTEYDTISGDKQKYMANGQRTFQNNYITQVGIDSIQFNRAFTSDDPQFGGSITIPAYSFPAHISADSDVIPVDIPNWLVYATAAAYDSTDVTRQNLVPRLEAKANQIMEVMKGNNDGQNAKLYQPWRPMGEQWSSQAWIS